MSPTIPALNVSRFHISLHRSHQNTNLKTLQIIANARPVVQVLSVLSVGTLVSYSCRAEWPNITGIYTQEHAEGWRKVVDTVSYGMSAVWRTQICCCAHQCRPSPVRARGGKFQQIGDAPSATPAREHLEPACAGVRRRLKRAAEYKDSEELQGGLRRSCDLHWILVLLVLVLCEVCRRNDHRLLRSIRHSWH